MAILRKLTDQHERQFENPWKMEKVSEAKLNSMMKAIVGFEIDIMSISGKSKLSQNRSEEDKAGVVAGLRAQNDVMSSTIANKIESIYKVLTG